MVTLSFSYLPCMKPNVTFEKRDHYILATGQGVRNDLTTIIEGTKKIQEIVNQYGLQYVLSDYREVIFNVSSTEAFNIVKVYESKLPEIKGVIIAAVISREFLDLLKFWESICQRRGFMYKVFTEIDEAEKWLLSQAHNNVIDDPAVNE